MGRKCSLRHIEEARADCPTFDSRVHIATSRRRVLPGTTVPLPLTFVRHFLLEARIALCALGRLRLRLNTCVAIRIQPHV